MQKHTEAAGTYGSYPTNTSLIEALSFSPSLQNPRFSFAFSDKMAIATFTASESNTMKTCEHCHDAYEFLIPHTPLPYLTNEDAVYFGEVGYIYPVQTGRKHGMKYPVNNVSYTSIAFDKMFFEEILTYKGHLEYSFNSVITCSDSLTALIEMFKKEHSKGSSADFINKLSPLSRVICAEVIDLAVKNTNDERKSKTKYQKGVRAAADYINEHFAESISIDYLSDLCGLSLNYFSLCFKNTFGETPKVYITKMRLSKAKTLLEFSNMSVKEISKNCGFHKFNSFSCSFKKYIGMTPSEYRDSIFNTNGG